MSDLSDNLNAHDVHLEQYGAIEAAWEVEAARNPHVCRGCMFLGFLVAQKAAYRFVMEHNEFNDEETAIIIANIMELDRKLAQMAHPQETPVQ